VAGSRIVTVFAYYLLQGSHSLWVQVGYDAEFQSKRT